MKKTRAACSPPVRPSTPRQQDQLFFYFIHWNYFLHALEGETRLIITDWRSKHACTRLQRSNNVRSNNHSTRSTIDNNRRYSRGPDFYDFSFS